MVCTKIVTKGEVIVGGGVEDEDGVWGMIVLSTDITVD